MCYDVDVFKKCPKCNTKCKVQIPLLVLGFGIFDLDNLETLIQLDDDELLMFRKHLMDTMFYCGECNIDFMYNGSKKDKIEKIKNTLFPEVK